MFRPLVLAVALATVIAIHPAAVVAADASDPERLLRGRYIALLGGCNDCHTAGFAGLGGDLPESQWLKGDAVGYQGPWGTTYPPNLRAYFAALDEDQWVALAPSFRARPPMPYWIINAMSEEDLRSLYEFVRSLGPPGEPAPAYAPPGQAVSTPVVVFPAPPPES